MSSAALRSSMPATVNFSSLFTAENYRYRKMLSGGPISDRILVDWVEKGQAPGDLEVLERTEGRSAHICCPPCVAAMPMASLAALQDRRSQELVELPMRAVVTAIAPRDADLGEVQFEMERCSV